MRMGRIVNIDQPKLSRFENGFEPSGFTRCTSCERHPMVEKRPFLNLKRTHFHLEHHTLSLCCAHRICHCGHATIHAAQGEGQGWNMRREHGPIHRLHQGPAVQGGPWIEYCPGKTIPCLEQALAEWTLIPHPPGLRSEISPGFDSDARNEAYGCTNRHISSQWHGHRHTLRLW